MKRNNSKEQSPIENAIAEDFSESVYFNSGHEVSTTNSSEVLEAITQRQMKLHFVILDFF